MIDNTQNTLDSRDIIERLEALQSEREACADAVSDCEEAYAYHDSDDTKSTPEYKDLCQARANLSEWDNSEEALELMMLTKLNEQGESYNSDWIHGVEIINDDYWLDYVTQLIDDAYPDIVPDSSKGWPYTCVKVDYEMAARDLQHDYAALNVCGQTYWIQCC